MKLEIKFIEFVKNRLKDALLKIFSIYLCGIFIGF